VIASIIRQAWPPRWSKSQISTTSCPSASQVATVPRWLLTGVATPWSR